MLPVASSPVLTKTRLSPSCGLFGGVRCAGWTELGFKYGEYLIMPSENLLKNHMPDDCDTVTKKRDHIKVWAKEYINILKKGPKYTKFNDGSWDFDVACDMVFSFWALHETPEGHPHRAVLQEHGIAYRCNCPNFNHYHVCKHSIALGMQFKGVKVPTKFSTVTMGKRKAPAGRCYGPKPEPTVPPTCAASGCARRSAPSQASILFACKHAMHRSLATRNALRLDAHRLGLPRTRPLPVLCGA